MCGAKLAEASRAVWCASDVEIEIEIEIEGECFLPMADEANGVAGGVAQTAVVVVVVAKVNPALL